MTRVVAIQPALRIGAVEWNLARVADLVTQAAREHSPDIIMLPEASTSPNAYDRRMRDVAQPVLGAPLTTLRTLARDHGCIVGGGFMSVRGTQARGSYALCEPDGAFHLHDKDIPSFWENNYYTRGRDDGVCETALGPIGLANGWEWGRTQTINRMQGRVRLLGGGMHFPTYPTWALTRKWFLDRDEHLLIQYARELPSRVARMLGVPAVHPSHVGDFVMQTPLVPGLKWPSRMIGETQICDADGARLAHMTYADGEGYVAAEVRLQEPVPRDPTPATFWNSTFPLSAHLVWYAGNAHGRLKYNAMSRLGMHRWEAGPDVADHVSAADAPPLPELKAERVGGTH